MRLRVGSRPRARALGTKQATGHPVPGPSRSAHLDELRVQFEGFGCIRDGVAVGFGLDMGLKSSMSVGNPSHASKGSMRARGHEAGTVSRGYLNTKTVSDEPVLCW